MICLRCGYCCKNSFVVVVDDPGRGVVKGNFVVYEGNGKPCKHLLGDKPGKYSCAIHDYPWYEETPCFSYPFGKNEMPPETACRIGKFILGEIEKKAGTSD